MNTATTTRPTAIRTAADALVHAMLLISPAGSRKSAVASSRPAVLNLASDALMRASNLIARYRSADSASSLVKKIADVRAMASRMQYTDHRFASELLAAADLQERETLR